ncbi:carbamoyltransferase family protein [sediment metagenome]|uniref:Carbamoyltransferase family protein n=1 Tax=sediment metagenome TaxID=749907 RepID=D9PI76_9ZZZZ
MKGGEIIAAVEEERINRIKYAPGQLPELAIREALKIGGISMNDVDIIATHGETWGDDFGFWLIDYIKYNFGHCPEIRRINHHDAHAASAFYASGFDKAMIITVDASGDGVSAQFSVGQDGMITLKDRINRPDSLGIFYSAMTQYCGFRRDSDEYKLMGLAAYGNPDRYDLSDFLSFGKGRITLNTEYLKPIKPGQSQPVRQNMAFSDKLIEKLGPKRLKHEPITQHYMDVAASAQKLLEQALVDMVTHFHKETGLEKLCMAGGVALNCMANKHLMNLPFIDDIFIQPAAGDAGVSLGAAMWTAVENGFRVKALKHVFLGSSFTNDEIEKSLKGIGISYKRLNNPAIYAAEMIAGNKIIGWFQGATEFGPRALGNRSILSNPAQPDMKAVLNAKIKHREPFRPFAPSLIVEDTDIFFSGKKKESPFMTINYDAKKGVEQKIPSVVHEDGTSRIQTVSRSENPLYYELLTEMKRLTGMGVVVNTSFNVDMQPIVNTPEEAVSTFFGCGMDALIIGSFLVEKK